MTDAQIRRLIDDCVVRSLTEYEQDIAGPAHSRLITDIENEFDSVVMEFDALKTEISALKAEVGALRADVTLSEATRRDNITPLKTRNGPDAA
jgi:hypothetical protein